MKTAKTTKVTIKMAIRKLDLRQEDFNVSTSDFSCLKVTSYDNQYYNCLAKMVIEYLDNEGYPTACTMIKSGFGRNCYNFNCDGPNMDLIYANRD